MKSCIIVGAGPGVSEAIARRFGTAGYHVGLISRTERTLQEMCDRLSNNNISVYWAAADAGDPTELKCALMQLVEKMGECDVLIYNAAVLRSGKPLELSTDQIASEFEVNVLGAHRAVNLLAPDMITRGSGAILFTGGGLSLEPFPEWTSLALSKAALRSLAISLFKELSPKGIHVAVLAICGIVAPDSPFDPKEIAEEYWRVATAPNGVDDREVVFQPPGTDPFYNDPEGHHPETSVLPEHARRREYRD